MKLPKEYDFVKVMLKYDPEEALNMAYKHGYNQGKIDALTEIIGDKENIKKIGERDE